MGEFPVLRSTQLQVFRFRTRTILKRVNVKSGKNDRGHQGETVCHRGYRCDCILRCIRFGRRPSDKSATGSCADYDRVDMF